MNKDGYRALAACLLLGTVGVVRAQNALDNSLKLDPQGNRIRTNVARPSLPDSVAQRNAIVTGNAISGLSFRGDVGYTAPREFRGTLASDDLFAFRRDSLASGLSGLGIRGTESLQVTFGLNSTGRLDRGFLAASGFERGAQFQAIPGRAGRLTGTMNPDVITPVAVSPRDPRLVPPGSSIGDTSPTGSRAPTETIDRESLILRSPSAYTADRLISGQMLGEHANPDGRVFTFSASPATGILRRPVADEEPAPRPGAVASGRVETSANPVLEDLRLAFDARAGEVGLATDDLSDQTPGERLQSYLGLGQQPDLADRDGGDSGPAPAFGFGDPAELPPVGEGDEADPAGDGSGLPGRRDRDVEEPLNPRERLLEDLRTLGISEEALRLLADQTLDVERFVRPQEAGGADIFTIHMRAGERLMRDGRYFEAEARYTRALSQVPGDPVAQIGRVHAAMGAGLYTSAAINLQEVFLTNAILIPVRYGASVLPKPDRMKRVIDDLSERTADADNPDAPLLALLLAYAGHQSNDAETVRLGLSRLPEGDRLGLLAELQWLPDEARGGE